MVPAVRGQTSAIQAGDDDGAAEAKKLEAGLPGAVRKVAGGKASAAKIGKWSLAKKCLGADIEARQGEVARMFVDVVERFATFVGDGPDDDDNVCGADAASRGRGARALFRAKNRAEVARSRGNSGAVAVNVPLGFQLMVAIGTALAGLSLLILFALWRRPQWLEQPVFLKTIALCLPLGFIAIEAGWTVPKSAGSRGLFMASCAQATRSRPCPV